MIIAVDAAVLAAAVRVEAGLKAHIRAVVVRNDAAAAVAEELRPRQRVLHRVPVRIPLQLERLEAVGWVAAGAAGWR